MRTMMARSIFGFPFWIAMTIAITPSALAGQSVAEQNSTSARQTTPSNGVERKVQPANRSRLWLDRRFIKAIWTM